MDLGLQGVHVLVTGTDQVPVPYVLASCLTALLQAPVVALDLRQLARSWVRLSFLLNSERATETKRASSLTSSGRPRYGTLQYQLDFSWSSYRGVWPYENPSGPGGAVERKGSGPDLRNRGGRGRKVWDRGGVGGQPWVLSVGGRSSAPDVIEPMVTHSWSSALTPCLALSTRESTFSSNVTSSFLVCREYLRHLEKANDDQKARANIVIIGSTAGKYGERDHADYAASKSGAFPRSHPNHRELTNHVHHTTFANTPVQRSCTASP
jgi:hypothetical protein